MTKESEEQRAIEIVKKGKRVKVDTSGFTSSVISVRLSHDVLSDLEIEAAKQNIGVTTYARLAIEEKLALSDSANLKRMSHVLNSFVEQMSNITSPDHKDSRAS